MPVMPLTLKRRGDEAPLDAGAVPMAMTLAARAGQQVVGDGAGLSSALAPRGGIKKSHFPDS
jgi:hypothetical protein